MKGLLLLALAAALPGCGGALRLREDLAAGRAEGIYLEGVPFEAQKPELCGPCALSSVLGWWGRPATQEDLADAVYRPGMHGSPGFLLWRQARKSGLVSLQAKGLEPAALDALLGQGVPVILNLDLLPGLQSCCLPLPRGGNFQHYVLAVGRDRTHGLWVLQNGERPDQVVSDAWLARRRAPTGGWALVAFPPDRKVSGLPPELHVEAADRTEELGQAGAALFHAQESVRKAPKAFEGWYRVGHLAKPEEAERAYRICMTLDPSRPSAPNNLALLLSADPSRKAEAEALARRALELCADPKWAHLRGSVEDTLKRILAPP